jgi:hypothetical protein
MVICCCCGASRGISGTLRREGQGEWCGYYEVSVWWPPFVSVKDRIVLAPMASFYNYFIKPHLPASCGAGIFRRGNEAEGQDFNPGAWAWFWLSRDLRMVFILESLRESGVWRVGRVPSHAGCISIRVAATFSVMCDILPLQSSRSMFGVLLVDLRS